MYRFALRPRWIVSHLLVAALVVTMVSLRFWQLRRLEDKRHHNRLVERRTSQPVAPVARVLPSGTGADAVEEAELRRVRATVSGSATARVWQAAAGPPMAGCPSRVKGRV